MEASEEVRFVLPPEGERWAHTWLLGPDYAICLTQKGKLPDELWSRFLDDIRPDHIGAILGMTIGVIEVRGSQRRAAAQAFAGKRLSAVLDNGLARGIAAAMNWVGLGIEGHSWTELDVALAALQRPALSDGVGRELVEQLLSRSGAPPLSQLSQS